MASEAAPGTHDPADVDDSALLAAHVAGDPEAFGMLFGRHRDRLWAVALRTCSDPETAADGLQDAMIAAYRRAESFRAESAVTTWLHRIVVNACLDRLRAAKVRRAEPLPDDLDRSDALAGHDRVVAGGGRADDPEQQALRGEQRARVLAALATLPPEQRAAVVLVDMEGYPVAEVAQILDCAEGTVKSRCSRGRARLAPLLGDLLGVVPTEETEGTADATAGGNPAADPHVGPLAPRGPPAPSGADH